MLKIALTGVKATDRYLYKKQRLIKSSLFTALRVEAFQRAKELRQGIQRGTLGLPELSNISRSTNRTTRRMRAMGKLTGYRVTDRDPPKVSFGFVGPKMTNAAARIVKRSAEGYTMNISAAKRERLARIGGTMSKRSKFRKAFFLRRTTTTAKVPAAPIVEPYHKKHRNEINRNIISKFKRKMAGERI